MLSFYKSFFFLDSVILRRVLTQGDQLPLSLSLSLSLSLCSIIDMEFQLAKIGEEKQ